MTDKTNNILVDFLICGTQKGGTTALNIYLDEHPEICLGMTKEIHFFDNEEYFVGDESPKYSIYHSWFNPSPSHKILGETTPIYMYWQNAPRRIWEYNPKMKLIVLLRNPIYRAYSHWNMERYRNADTLSFWDAIKNEQERCREALPYQHRVYSYIDRGFYLTQLRRLWSFFSQDRVLIIKSEYFKKQPDQVLLQICNFLEVAPFKNIPIQKNLNLYPYQSNRIQDKEKDYLKYIFEYEIKGLERVLGWDCSDWLLE